MPPRDVISGRGKHVSTPFATATFVGLRALDPFLQQSILAYGTGISIIKFFGSDLFAQGPTSNVGYALLDNLNLSPYRLIIFGMAVGSSLKQSFWKLFIGQEEMSVGAAVSVGIFNTVFNSINSLLFICRATSPAYGQGEGPHWNGWPGTPLVVGASLYAIGILTETICEIQRASFKRKPENKGKPYTGGLFGLARHINYMGYTVWRAGYALACGGWIWGAVVGTFFFWDFSSRAVPTLDEYCGNRYADMWKDYKAKTRYVLIPYIY